MTASDACGCATATYTMKRPPPTARRFHVRTVEVCAGRLSTYCVRSDDQSSGSTRPPRAPVELSRVRHDGSGRRARRGSRSAGGSRRAGCAGHPRPRRVLYRILDGDRIRMTVVRLRRWPRKPRTVPAATSRSSDATATNPPYDLCRPVASSATTGRPVLPTDEGDIGAMPIALARLLRACRARVDGLADL